MLVVQHWVEVVDCRSPPRCPQTNEKLGFVHLETDRLGGLDHFFTQLLTCAAVSFLDSSTPSMSMCLGLPVLLPMRLWLPTPTTLRSGQEFSLVLLFLNAVWCRHLREDTFVRTRGGHALHWKDFSPTTATTGHSGTIGLVPPTSSWALWSIILGRSIRRFVERNRPTLLQELRAPQSECSFHDVGNSLHHASSELELILQINSIQRSERPLQASEWSLSHDRRSHWRRFRASLVISSQQSQCPPQNRGCHVPRRTVLVLGLRLIVRLQQTQPPNWMGGRSHRRRNCAEEVSPTSNSQTTFSQQPCKRALHFVKRWRVSISPRSTRKFQEGMHHCTNHSEGWKKPVQPVLQQPDLTPGFRPGQQTHRPTHSSIS